MDATGFTLCFDLMAEIGKNVQYERNYKAVVGSLNEVRREIDTCVNEFWDITEEEAADEYSVCFFRDFIEEGCIHELFVDYGEPTWQEYQSGYKTFNRGYEEADHKELQGYDETFVPPPHPLEEIPNGIGHP